MRKKHPFWCFFLKAISNGLFNIVEMERKISYILFNLQCLAILVSFLLILFKTINNKRVTNYSLLIYIAFGFVIMFPMFLNTNGIVSIPYSNSINNASILIGFSILSFNMIRSISFKSFRMILGIIFCLQFSLFVSASTEEDR